MFEELYYMLYESSKKQETNDNHEFKAFVGITFLQYINILTLFGFANYFLMIDIPKNTGSYAGGILFILVSAINFFVLYRKKDSIIKKYDLFSAKRKGKGKLYYRLYVLITILLFLYVIWNLVPRRY